MTSVKFNEENNNVKRGFFLLMKKIFIDVTLVEKNTIKNA